MYGISPRLQRQFDKCQREYDNATPPEWNTLDYADDCGGMDCGECEACVTYQAEYAAELAAENAYDLKREEKDYDYEADDFAYCVARGK